MMGDCAPQVTPVWVDYDQGNILINTAEGRTKVRNVAKNPNVALCVTDSANPYTMVSVRGRIIEKTSQGEPTSILTGWPRNILVQTSIRSVHLAKSGYF